MTANSQFVSVRETAQILSISEKKVMDLIEQRKLQAYRIADKFLRFKKSDVMALRSSGKVNIESANIEYTQTEKITDFPYFNDFYLTSCLLIIFLLYFILFT